MKEKCCPYAVDLKRNSLSNRALIANDITEPGIWKCWKQNSVLSRGGKINWSSYDFDKKINKLKLVIVILVNWKYFLINKSINSVNQCTGIGH